MKKGFNKDIKEVLNFIPNLAIEFGKICNDKDFKRLEKLVYTSTKPIASYAFAKEFSDKIENVEPYQKAIFSIKRNEMPYLAYTFAKDVKNANLKEIENYILKNGDSNVACMYAKDFKPKNVKMFEDKILNQSEVISEDLIDIKQPFSSESIFDKNKVNVQKVINVFSVSSSLISEQKQKFYKAKICADFVNNVEGANYERIKEAMLNSDVEMLPIFSNNLNKIDTDLYDAYIEANGKDKYTYIYASKLFKDDRINYKKYLVDIIRKAPGLGEEFFNKYVKVEDTELINDIVENEIQTAQNKISYCNYFVRIAKKFPTLAPNMEKYALKYYNTSRLSNFASEIDVVDATKIVDKLVKAPDLLKEPDLFGVYIYSN